jgi:hypothetical protein
LCFLIAGLASPGRDDVFYIAVNEVRDGVLFRLDGLEVAALSNRNLCLSGPFFCVSYPIESGRLSWVTLHSNLNPKAYGAVFGFALFDVGQNQFPHSSPIRGIGNKKGLA